MPRLVKDSTEANGSPFDLIYVIASHRVAFVVSFWTEQKRQSRSDNLMNSRIADAEDARLWEPRESKKIPFVVKWVAKIRLIISFRASGALFISTFLLLLPWIGNPIRLYHGECQQSRNKIANSFRRAQKCMKIKFCHQLRKTTVSDLLVRASIKTGKCLHEPTKLDGSSCRITLITQIIAWDWVGGRFFEGVVRLWRNKRN